MPQVNAPLYSMNAGVVSRLGLGRIDLARLRIAAEVQQNLMPRVLGPAIFRPGTEYLDRTYSNSDVRFIPFVFNAAEKALLEISQTVMRVFIDGVVLTRPTVTAAVTNGTFTSDLSGWSDEDESGATSSQDGGYMRLEGTGANFAERRQEVTVNEAGVEHALRIIVAWGPVILAVGSSDGLDDYVAETPLRTGTHSIAFTPSGNFHISLKSDANAARLIDSVAVEGAGVVTIPHPWSTHYVLLRYAQSGDVIFVASDDIQQQRIERRSERSWSICEYNTLDGPFRPINAGSTTITPDGVSGTVTLTASRALFKATHVGSLWRLTNSGQTATASLDGDDQFTDPVRVTGVSEPAASDTRPFVIVITGLTGTGTTVTLQRSFGEPGAWLDVETYTSNITKTFDDGFDNQIVYYRLGIVSGDYSSGSIDATLTYASSIQKGIVRIISYSSTTSVGAEVVTTLGSASATSDWEEGEWSDYRGYPSAVAFHDGRLWWGWKDRVFGSVSDSYTSFDDTVEGDSGPVIRSVATGPIEGIKWLLSLQRFLAGTASFEVSMRSSSFDEPITPTAFTARNFSSRGCANLQALNVDGRGIFVQRNQKRVYGASFDVNGQDYSSTDLTRLVPDLLDNGIVDVAIIDMAVQRQPDTRVWFVTNDGRAVVLVYEPEDEVVAWITIASTGAVLAVGVLPGEDEDEVYLAVRRGEGIVCVERFAKLSEVVGATLTKTVDSHVVYEGASTDTISGLDHLEGLRVAAWAGGVPLPDLYEVVSGDITLPAAVTSAVVGLSYEGKFKSSKLANGAATGTAVSKEKRVDHVALMMADVTPAGIRIGKSFDDLTSLPKTLNNGRPLISTEVLASYDYSGAPFNGGWEPDSRVCIKISSPYCGTFMGAVIQMATNDAAAFGTRPTGG